MLKNKDELKSRHLPRHHAFAVPHWDPKAINALSVDEEDAWRCGDFTLEHLQIEETDRPVEASLATLTMDTTTAGRGQREKKPSEKVKETIGKKIELYKEDITRKQPPVYNADHVKASAEVKEVEKFYHHTKITATGDKYDFYQLGSQ